MADLTVFISDEDKKNLTKDQALKKFFGFTSNVEDGKIVSVTCDSGETLTLKTTLSMECELKDLMNKLKVSVSETLKDVFCAAVKLQNINEILTTPGQTSFLIHQLCFDDKVSGCIDSKEKLAKLLIERQKVLNELRIRHKDSKGIANGKLSNIITFEVRNQHILKTLIDSEDAAAEYNSCFRYSCENGALECKVDDFCINYAFEDFTCHRHLVQTPLTNFTYREIAKALCDENALFGALGPAGTGKTETCKNFANLIGRMPVVFNCSDCMEPEKWASDMMAKRGNTILIFDEANRMSAEDWGHLFKDKNLAGIHITCNPGYAGRVEIPQSIKKVMWPVGFQVPDFEDIVEVMLVLAGHDNARKKSKQLMNMVKAMRVTLTRQCHYDFGLRMIKRVVTHAENNSVAEALHRAIFPSIVDEDKEIYFKFLKSHFGCDLGELTIDQKVEYVSNRHSVGFMGSKRAALVEALKILAKNKGIPLVETTLGDEFANVLRSQKSETWYLMEYPEKMGCVALESMNMLMDDNKRLPLESGELIPLADSKVFLTGANADDLSPANVSRMAIAWLD